MRVSFIVGLYNCLPLTREMLASLQKSIPQGLDYEIIFVDDFSTDQTRDWLTTLPSPCSSILNDKNYGYAVSNNRGAAKATGDILIFNNNDLVFRSGWLEALLKVHAKLGTHAGLIGNVQRNVSTGLIDHAGIFINSKGKPTHIKHRPLSYYLGNTIRRDTLTTGACFLISKELWNKLGGFDERYINGCEDIDLGLKARTIGKINAIALSSVIDHHISQSPGRKKHDETNSYTLTSTWKNTLALLAVPDWCRQHFEAFLPEPRDFPNDNLARKIACYLLGLRSVPLQETLPLATASLDKEIERWKVMFKNE